VLHNDTIHYSDYLVLVFDYGKMCMEHWWDDMKVGKQVCSVKPVLVPLCSPQISHELDWDQTQPSKVRGAYHHQLWSYITVNPSAGTVQGFCIPNIVFLKI
jgi:hypothetical protein